MSIQERLKEARRDMSQKAASELCGIKQPAWVGYEKGKSLPGAEAIIKICIHLGVSADWLLGLDTGGGGGVSVTANGPGAQAAGRDLTVSSPPQPNQPPQTLQTSQTSPSGDCSKCQLLADHIRRITGLG